MMLMSNGGSKISKKDDVPLNIGMWFTAQVQDNGRNVRKQEHGVGMMLLVANNGASFSMSLSQYVAVQYPVRLSD